MKALKQLPIPLRQLTNRMEWNGIEWNRMVCKCVCHRLHCSTLNRKRTKLELHFLCFYGSLVTFSVFGSNKSNYSHFPDDSTYALYMNDADVHVCVHLVVVPFSLRWDHVMPTGTERLNERHIGAGRTILNITVSERY